MSQPAKETALVVGLEAVRLRDRAQVGGKNAALGELLGELVGRGLRVPPGFATTVEAYELFLTESGLRWELEAILRGLDVRNVANLQRVSAAARQLLLSAPLPARLQTAIAQSYRRLCQAEHCADLPVAVRSSATAEDLPEASFAGQQESYLHVRGAENVVAAVQRCMSSLFTERALSYREERGIEHRRVGISVAVQRMVNASDGAAGVAFSIDPDTGFSQFVVLQASYGLGEAVVGGKVVPDEFVVFKPTLRSDHRPVLRRRMGTKEVRCVFATAPTQGTQWVETSPDERRRYCLNEEDVLALARWTVLVEDHYQTYLGASGGVDVEWAKDGESGELFLLQARPETVHRGKKVLEDHIYELQGTGDVLVRGQAIGHRIATGAVQTIADASSLQDFRPGSVLVTDMTDPDWEPVMKSAAAIVTNRGGRTCHAAIVSRELGLPAVVGTTNATELLHESDDVTVDCASGSTGLVYAGQLPYRTIAAPHFPPCTTKVHLEVNVGTPEEALRASRRQIHGVGLAREEFIIASEIGIHPLALVHPDRLDAPTQRAILKKTTGTSEPREYFVERLAEGVAMIAAAFWPRPVLVRLSDFKSNEYAHLIGGTCFEPHEENPMLGLRGASRYYHPLFREAFAMECEAHRRVRTDYGLTNVRLMVPFCRTPAEGERVLQLMKEAGLERGMHDLQVFMMCEVPSNIILAAQFAAMFDGFSIGTNDLTQLMLGVDRDSASVAPLFDEGDPAVMEVIRRFVEVAHHFSRPVGVCGQAPSDRPELIEALVDAGVDAISVSPDALTATSQAMAIVEQSRAKGPSVPSGPREERPNP